MSQVVATKVEAVFPHPNADRLEIIKFGSYTVVTGKGEIKLGDIVAHFPPDTLIPVRVAETLGVAQYLKSAVYPGGTHPTKCRVAAVRLRGTPSFGFMSLVDEAEEGEDLSEAFSAVKFEPPEPAWYRNLNTSNDHPAFHTYTKIRNFRGPKVGRCFEPGTPVRITEKIHGTNSRIGLIDGEFMVGSHKRTVPMPKATTNNRLPVYWTPVSDEIKGLLDYLCGSGCDAIIFGEIFGSKVQCMDYGQFAFDGYRVFDISVGGNYLDWSKIVDLTDKFGIKRVPLLYEGNFVTDLVDKLVDGPTTLASGVEVRSSFKGREGVVITPLVEQFSAMLGGRLIAKAVSADYLAARKTDFH